MFDYQEDQKMNMSINSKSDYTNNKQINLLRRYSLQHSSQSTNVPESNASDQSIPDQFSIKSERESIEDNDIISINCTPNTCHLKNQNIFTFPTNFNILKIDNHEDRTYHPNDNYDVENQIDEIHSDSKSDKFQNINSDNNTKNCKNKNKRKKAKRGKKKIKEKIVEIPEVKYYKTDLCKQQMDKGYCSQGDICNQAHGQSQLNERKCFNQKTKFCDTFKKQGMCKYGPRCNFIHKTENPKLKMYNLLVSFGIDKADLTNKSLKY